jgi:hypothetical protein
MPQYEIEEIKGEERFTKFADMMEMIMSAPMNPVLTEEFIDCCDNNILKDFVIGLVFVHKTTIEIVERRKHNANR